MTKSKTTLTTAGLVAAMLFAGPATAQMMDWSAAYIGGSIGQSQAKDACDGAAFAGVTCDDKDTAWKIFAGYQFNRNFAVEVGYTDLGEVSASAGGATVSAEATALEVVGIGSIPVADRFSVYGKLGLYRGETDLSSNFGVSGDESNNDLTFGFGVRFDLSRNAAIRAEWQRYGDVGGDSTGESDIDVMSVGLIWRF